MDFCSLVPIIIYQGVAVIYLHFTWHLIYYGPQLSSNSRLRGACSARVTCFAGEFEDLCCRLFSLLPMAAPHPSVNVWLQFLCFCVTHNLAVTPVLCFLTTECYHGFPWLARIISFSSQNHQTFAVFPVLYLRNPSKILLLFHVQQLRGWAWDSMGCNNYSGNILIFMGGNLHRTCCPSVGGHHKHIFRGFWTPMLDNTYQLQSHCFWIC